VASEFSSNILTLFVLHILSVPGLTYHVNSTGHEVMANNRHDVISNAFVYLNWADAACDVASLCFCPRVLLVAFHCSTKISCKLVDRMVFSRCRHGYLCLFAARCRLAYGSADATATHCLLLQ